MRFAAIALLAAAVFVAPLQAKAETGGTVFSGFFCRQHLPCDPSDAAFPSIQQLVSMSNSCIAQNTGSTLPNGFFDGTSGLNGNNCLSSSGGAAEGANSIPVCCVVPVTAGDCAIHCDLVSH